MKYTNNIIRRLWIILLVAACTTSSEQKVQKIDNQELSEQLNNREVQLIDVRTSGEVSGGRIAGAKHIDFYDPEFTSEINSLDREKPVVVYCATGGRSAKAVETLKELGFKEIHDLEGGFQSWQKEGYPVAF